jgi:hypothetical protein
MDGALFPLLLVAAAGIFQGTSGLGMKNFKPLSWEVWWLTYGLVATVVLPLAWALAVLPDPVLAIAAPPPDAVAKGFLFQQRAGAAGRGMEGRAGSLPHHVRRRPGPHHRLLGPGIRQRPAMSKFADAPSSRSTIT